MTAALVAPKTCRKCKGSGDFQRASGAVDICWTCIGTGKVESDRATLAAAKADRDEAARVSSALFTLAHAHRQGYLLSKAGDGLHALKSADPARYAKALASLEAGHPGLVKALADYYTSTKA